MRNVKILFIAAVLITIFSLLAVPLADAKAMGLSFGTHTTIYLTARVQNKWWYAGNLNCRSATLETLGQTYTGEIAQGNWWGLAGNESCFIVFSGVPYPLALTPANVTITYFTLAGDEAINMVTADRQQVQQENYFLELQWYDDYVVLDDMILNDTATVPVINYDPTALPPLPEVPGLPTLP